MTAGSSKTGTYGRCSEQVGRSQGLTSSFSFIPSLICFLLCEMGVSKFTPSFDSWMKRGDAHYD